MTKSCSNCGAWIPPNGPEDQGYGTCVRVPPQPAQTKYLDGRKTIAPGRFARTLPNMFCFGWTLPVVEEQQTIEHNFRIEDQS